MANTEEETHKNPVVETQQNTSEQTQQNPADETGQDQDARVENSRKQDEETGRKQDEETRQGAAPDNSGDQDEETRQGAAPDNSGDQDEETPEQNPDGNQAKKSEEEDKEEETQKPYREKFTKSQKLGVAAIALGLFIASPVVFFGLVAAIFAYKAIKKRFGNEYKEKKYTKLLEETKTEANEKIAKLKEQINKLTGELDKKKKNETVQEQEITLGQKDIGVPPNQQTGTSSQYKEMTKPLNEHQQHQQHQQNTNNKGRVKTRNSSKKENTFTQQMSHKK